ADMVVVGQFAGSDSLAAVGGNSFVISLMVGLFMGMSVGTNVQMAVGRGRNDENAMARVLHTSLLFSVLCGTVLDIVGLVMAGQIHAWLGTGAAGSSLREQAVLYFRIYFAGMPFIMLYNFESALLRSKGDTRRPLFVLTLSGILNVALNLVFVRLLHRAADGVAFATTISNAFSAMALLYLLAKEEGPYRVSFSRMRIDGRTLAGIIRVGLPAGVQSSMFSIANVILQASTNALGQAAIAGTTVGLYSEYFGADTIAGFSQAVTTFVGQNYGAGNLKRCRQITRIGVICGGISTFLVNLLVIVMRERFVAIFTFDAAVAAVACIRITNVSLFQAFNGIGEILSGAMRGMNRSLVPALLSVFSICGVRLVWVFGFYPANQTYENLIVAYPLSWACSLLLLTFAYFLVRRRVDEAERHHAFRRTGQ
ncbi:MAG: MATE family efflux transporter, partial [Clostridia bacterium]|nr:MATE family efflux transporter [Clostridia bacterium]